MNTCTRFNILRTGASIVYTWRYAVFVVFTLNRYFYLVPNISTPSVRADYSCYNCQCDFFSNHCFAVYITAVAAAACCCCVLLHVSWSIYLDSNHTSLGMCLDLLRKLSCSYILLYSGVQCNTKAKQVPSGLLGLKHEHNSTKAYDVFPPEVIFRSRVIGTCRVTTDCIVAMS